jgi:3-hydroxyacyl-CoA dehydrogenase
LYSAELGKPVGVVGGGTMGRDIAAWALDQGRPVILTPMRATSIGSLSEAISDRYGRRVERGQLTRQEFRQRLGALDVTADSDRLLQCDWVIEAVREDLALKRLVFERLERQVSPACLLATSTSTLRVSDIAEGLRTADRVIGLHFFSPAHLIKLVEVAPGRQTAEGRVKEAVDALAEMGKVPVLVGDVPGFAANRMFHERHHQATLLVQDGAPPWRVDEVMKRFGFKYGPFEVADLAGLDVGWSPGAATGDPLRDALCSEGRLGRKAGAGYYDYDDRMMPLPSAMVESIAKRLARNPPREFSDDEIRCRCICTLINAAAGLIADRVVSAARDIDLIASQGFGWPAPHDGPAAYADYVGIDAVVSDLRRHKEFLGPDFRITPLLLQLAAAGAPLSDASAMG